MHKGKIVFQTKHLQRHVVTFEIFPEIQNFFFLPSDNYLISLIRQNIFDVLEITPLMLRVVFSSFADVHGV